MRKILACLLFVVLTQVSVVTNAVVPQQLNFQSKLNTASGGLFNGQVDLTFEIFEDLAANTSTGWTETHAAVDVSDSVYSVAIGSVTPFSNVPGLFGDPRYMRISILPLTDENGNSLSGSGVLEVMSPLLPFRSVAYSFYAENAESIADNAVDSDSIDDGSVSNNDLADGAVNSAKIENGAIAEVDVATGAVTSDKISDGTVAAIDLATDSVGADEILTGAVGSSEIATDAVGADEILADAVGSSEIATDAVGSDELAAGAVVSGKLATDAVGSSNIAADAVTTAKILNGAVTADKISGAFVTGLDADLLDGKDSTAFLQLAGGPQTVAELHKFDAGIKFADDTVQLTAGTPGIPAGDEVVVPVDCGGGEKIQDALDAALAGGTLTITVKGTCNETVTVSRDHVKLIGDDSDGVDVIIGQHAGQGAVNVRKVQDVVIYKINLQTAVATPADTSTEGGHGLMVYDKGGVWIGSSTISNAHIGVFANRDALVRMDTVTIQDTVTSHGILLIDGASARVDKSTININLASGGPFYPSAVELNRGASIRLRDNITIANAASGGTALYVYNQGQVRLDKGTNTITGNVDLSSVSNMELMDFTLVGNVSIRGGSLLNMRTNQDPNDPTVTGDIDIDFGQLRTRNDLRIVGNINAWARGSASLGDNGSVTGDVTINRGLLSLGSGVTIDGRVAISQSSFQGADNVVLSNDFDISQSEATISGTGAEYTGNIRVSDNSKVMIDPGLGALSPIECSLSNINISDSTIINPGGGQNPFNLQQCQLYTGQNSQIDGNIDARNGSSIGIGDGTQFNGDVNVSYSELSLSENVDFNGRINGVGAFLSLGGTGTDIDGEIDLATGSELFINDPAPTFHQQLRCADSLLNFYGDVGTVSFGAGIGSPVIDAFRNCNLSIGEKVTIEGDISVGIGSTVQIASTAQINGDLWASGASINMDFGAGIDGNLSVADNSALSMHDNGGTPGTNDITGFMELAHSSANINNNLTSITSISVRENSDLRIGSGLAWILPDQIQVENQSHVEISTYDGATSLTRSGGPDFIFGLDDNSSLRLGDLATLTGDVGIGAGSSLRANDDVTITGSIYAGHHAGMSFGSTNIVNGSIFSGNHASMNFGSTNVVTGSINCDGPDGIVSGDNPVDAGGGGGSPTAISGCTDRP